MQRSISMFDLFLSEDSKKIIIEGNEDKLNKLLFEIGFDINKEIEYDYCNHRPMSTNVPYLGWRLIGTERTDIEWMKSKYCSKENRFEQIGMKDLSLLKEILEMSKEGNFTQMIIEHISD